eukprot:ANDGO_03066.mRNA.1 Protein KTI12 homolog
MPLIMMCGVPCSGKSTRAAELRSHFESLGTYRAVHSVSLDTLNIQRYLGHATPVAEKSTRAAIKAQVERLSSPDAVLIVDYQNDIKGFRYELYCVSRESGNPSCVVWCRTDAETCIGFHAASNFSWARPFETTASSDNGPSLSMDTTLFDQLCFQFERPIEQNRWDAPLFTLDTSETTPCSAISAAMLGRRGAVQPVNATRPQRLCEAGFLGELETICSDILQFILKTYIAKHKERASMGLWTLAVSGLPHCKDVHKQFCVDVSSAFLNDEKGNLLAADLRKAKNVFVKAAQVRTPDRTTAGDTFVTFLNGHVGQAVAAAENQRLAARQQLEEEDIGI